MSDDADAGARAERPKPDRGRKPNPRGAEFPFADTIDAPVSGTPSPHPATATHTLPSTPADGDAADDQPVIQLGDYDVLGEIARGGMGVVYKARHRKLNRVVALKVTRAGHLVSDGERKRFQAEVEAAGQLDHPNIVPVYEAGEAGGFHYFSMALVEGPSLAERVADHPLSPREAAGLIRQAAAAVAYAHGHGVVHRDLKPGNILLDAAGQPRITDFGLAKRTDADSSLTQAGQIMGTPNFMPPEQAEGKNEQVGPLAEVYSLGATLYCLLTGRPPFQAATVVDTLKQVVEREPIAPHSLNPAVPRDLDTICLKCLQKRPDRRYPSAADLRDDLQRFLDRRPIAAHPVGAVEKGVRWCRRNPAVAGAAAGVVAVVVVAFVLVSGSYVRAERARADEAFHRQQAERKERSERWERYRSNLTAAGSAMRLHNVGAARDALDAAPAEHRGWEWKHFYHQLDMAAQVRPASDMTGFVLASSPDRRTIMIYSNPEQSMYFFDLTNRRVQVQIPNVDCEGRGWFSRDGKRAAFITRTQTVRIWNLQERRWQATLEGHTGAVVWLDFHPDGRRIVTGSQDQTCRVWDVSTGKQLLILGAHPDEVGRTRVSADGKRIFTQSGRLSQLWDADTGAKLGEFRGFMNLAGTLKEDPTGERLAVTEFYPSNRIRILDLTTCQQVAELTGHTNQINDIAFSPDGTRLASCGLDQTVRLWDARDGKPLATLTGHAGWVTTIAFSPDGTRLVSGAQDQTVRLWDGTTGAALAVLHGHTVDVEYLIYSPDGGSVVAIAQDGAIRWFDVRLAEQNGVLRGHTSFVYGVAFHPDGERVASAAWDGTVRVWNATTGRELAMLKHSDKAVVTSVAFHPDGQYLVSQGRDDDVHLWDLDAKRLIHRFPIPTQLWQDSRLTFSRDGKLLAAGARDNTVHVWDFASRKEVAVLTGHTRIVRDLVFGPDGSWLATASELGDNTVRIWDVATGKERRALTDHANVVYALALSPDGQALASGSHDGTVRLWDTTTWQVIDVLKQGTNVYGLSFTPDGQRLAVACANNTIRLWDVATHKPVGELHGHTAYVHQLAFSPDGSRLVSGSGDMTVRVWDTLPAAQRAAPR